MDDLHGHRAVAFSFYTEACAIGAPDFLTSTEEKKKEQKQRDLKISVCICLSVSYIYMQNYMYNICMHMQ